MSTSEHDWNHSAKRAQLRVGTVLEPADGGHLRVREVTAAGIICRGGNQPRALWTWDQLSALRATIRFQPTEADGSDTLDWDIRPRLTGYFRRFAPTLDEPGPDATVLEFILAVGSRMTMVPDFAATGGWLVAAAPPEHGFDPGVGLRLAACLRASSADVAVDAALAAAVRALRAHMLLCQGYTWRRAEIGIVPHQDRWRVRVDFAYDHETDEANDARWRVDHAACGRLWARVRAAGATVDTADDCDMSTGAPPHRDEEETP
jgi:hypothetical protein